MFVDNGIDDDEVYTLNYLSVDFLWIKVYLKSNPIFFNKILD